MGWFNDDSEQGQAWFNFNDSLEFDSSIIHELIGRAASYEAAKFYETHIAEQGEPESEDQAKEILASFVHAFVERGIEQKGLGDFDKEEAMDIASQILKDAYEAHGNPC